MKTAIKIREATQWDLREIIECLKVLTKAEYNEDVDRAFEEIEQIGNTFTFVALDNEKIVGTASLVVQPKLIRGGSKMGYIEDVAVLEAYHGQGVGKQLIVTLVNLAKSFGCYKVILNCEQHNIDFYKKLGFEEHDVGMRLDLTDEPRDIL